MATPRKALRGRFIRRQICQSKSVASLIDVRGPWGGLLFDRLILWADDDGRFIAEPKVIKANCLPWHPRSENQLWADLSWMRTHKMITLYRVAGCWYGVFTKWTKHQPKQKADRYYPSELPEPPPPSQHGAYFYGKGWRELSDTIIERDGGRCRICQSTKGLVAHHIIPFWGFATSEEANRPENLVALCSGCHPKARYDAISETARRQYASDLPPTGGAEVEVEVEDEDEVLGRRKKTPPVEGVQELQTYYVERSKAHTDLANPEFPYAQAGTFFKRRLKAGDSVPAIKLTIDYFFDHWIREKGGGAFSHYQSQYLALCKAVQEGK